MTENDDLIDALRALNWVVGAHSPQDITLPDGSWGLNCPQCEGWTYPCLTIKMIREFMS